MAISYANAATALQNGDRILVTHADPNKPNDRIKYGLIRGGQTVAAPTFRKLFDNLRPVNDGLFGEEMAQTYEWNPDT